MIYIIYIIYIYYIDIIIFMQSCNNFGCTFII